MRDTRIINRVYKYLGGSRNHHSPGCRVATPQEMDTISEFGHFAEDSLVSNGSRCVAVKPSHRDVVYAVDVAVLCEGQG